MTANSFTANDPDDLWCVDHNTYTDRCLYRHDRPNGDDLPDPWPDARPGPEDDPDLFQCVHCERFRSIDERHDYGDDGPGSYCDACAVGP